MNSYYKFRIFTNYWKWCNNLIEKHWESTNFLQTDADYDFSKVAPLATGLFIVQARNETFWFRKTFLVATTQGRIRSKISKFWKFYGVIGKKVSFGAKLLYFTIALIMFWFFYGCAKFCRGVQLSQGAQTSLRESADL